MVLMRNVHNKFHVAFLPLGGARPAYLLTVFVAAAVIWPSAVFGKATPESFADLAQKLLPAVVNISTTQVVKQGQRGPEVPQFPPGSPFEEFFREFFDRQRPNAPPRKQTSLGSGFVIDPTGYIVTNNHVIAEADEISVKFQDGTLLEAKIVGKDPKTDIALLKVKPDGKLPSVKFGNSDKSRVGDWILAIGNPFGLGGTVTAGIVSARARELSGPYDDYIQTDASINRGNSGGPMFNLKGEVIGINTAIFSPSGGSVGIGFAVPSALAKPVVDQLRSFGRTKRGWLGVHIQTVTEELAESLGLDGPRGALVASVTNEGPAQKAGILDGDVILSFNNKPVNEMRRLPRLVAETTVGKSVEVLVWRKGKKIKKSVTLGELEKAENSVASLKDRPETKRKTPKTIESLGLTLLAITPELREKYKLSKDTKGVVVIKVAEGSAAAKKGVRPGTVVLKMGQDQEQVLKPAQVAGKVQEAQKAKAKTILLLLEREGNQRFVALKIDPKKSG